MKIAPAGRTGNTAAWSRSPRRSTPAPVEIDRDKPAAGMLADGILCLSDAMALASSAASIA